MFNACAQHFVVGNVHDKVDVMNTRSQWVAPSRAGVRERTHVVGIIAKHNIYIIQHPY
jgi:hypothetical protein